MNIKLGKGNLIQSRENYFIYSLYENKKHISINQPNRSQQKCDARTM